MLTAVGKRVNFDSLWHPTQKQKEAMEALKKYKYLLYGGAMGGGKSYWLRWALVYLLLKWFSDDPEQNVGVRVGLFCEDYPALKDRHIARVPYEFPRWLGVMNKAEYEFALYSEFGNGIICFRNLDDPSKYQSAEFAAIAVDELTKNTKEVFDFLRTRLRWSGISDTKFLAASNPGGVGHNWVKQFWMDRKFEATELEAHLFHFIPAKAIDNPYLGKSYFRSLEGLPAEMRKAFVEGDWNLFKGQFFSEWRDAKHVVVPFPIPSTWKKFRSYDHGRENPACCKWYALDYDGRIWVYRELYVKGLNANQIAQKIVKMTPPEEEIEYTVADTSIFSKHGFVDKFGGQTIAEIMAKNGVTCIPASKERHPGWALMHQYLYWDEHTTPKMIYFMNCADSIRTIPTLIYDENHPEDLDTRSEDHAADADRYMLMTLHERKVQVPLTPGERAFYERERRVAEENPKNIYEDDIVK